MRNNIQKYFKLLYIYWLLKEKKTADKNSYIWFRMWKRRFRAIWAFSPGLAELIAEEFTSNDIHFVSGTIKKQEITQYTPVLFCVIRNDIQKIKTFMEHYRSHGIKEFVFLDNHSNDGTAEYLSKQTDVILYSNHRKFNSELKVAWLNWMIDKHGEDRWCLVVDSDELLRFIGDETHKINDVIGIAEKMKYKRIEGFMLDMYPKEDILAYQGSNEEWESDYRFFDKDSYEVKRTSAGVSIFGGPRDRVICEVGNFKYLSKYPLFKLKDNDVYASSHFLLPVLKDEVCPIWIALCHYKFVGEKDMKKLKEATLKRQYAGDSYLYRIWKEEFDKKKSVTFYDLEKSAELRCSNNLLEVSFIESPFQEENVR